MVSLRFLTRFAFCASFFALGVIALGAFTRLIDAGLGCPDWPGCYGQITVPLSEGAQKLALLHYPESHLIAYKAWAEMIHRYFVAGLSLFILSIITLIFSQKKLRTRGNILLSLFLIVLLGYQIMLGQWTVTLKLLPVIVSQHLLGGYFILATLWVVYLNNAQLRHPRMLLSGISSSVNRSPTEAFGNDTWMVIFSVLALILLLMQILLGAWTSTNYASLSCVDFPFCTNDQTMQWHWRAAFNLFSPIGINYEGGVLPVAIRQTIQMAHRFGALILTSYLLIFSMIASHFLKNRPELLKILYLILGLLCVQLCIGISNVVLKLPLVSALSHTLVAALLLISLLTFIVKLIQCERGANT